MTAPTARRLLLLGGAAAIILVAFMLLRDDAPQGPAAGAGQPVAAATIAEIPVADVRLELLQADRSALSEPDRNPFRFEARSVPEAPGPRESGPPPRPVVAPPPPLPMPSGPPPPPPIPLRFIGLVEAPTQVGRVAILSDGRGNVFHGREGDIIEGRYRVLTIGADAVELAHLDGRGRQTIRLSGQ